MFYVTNFERCDKFDERYGMKKIHDFIKSISTPDCKTKNCKCDSICNSKCLETFKGTNIGYSPNEVLVLEVALPGFKKENISVTYNGNVIVIDAKYNQESNINFVVNNVKHKDVFKKFYLVDNYINGELKWKFTDGLLLITIKKGEDSSNVDPSADDDDIIGTPDTGEQTDPTQNIP